jgi:hypothetical protein
MRPSSGECWMAVSFRVLRHVDYFRVTREELGCVFIEWSLNAWAMLYL